MALQLSHIKQNAIRFSCPEHEYNSFLTQNGILAPNSCTILDQFRRQQMLQTARTKAKSRKQVDRASSEMSQSTASMQDSSKPTNASTVEDAKNSSQPGRVTAEETKESRDKTFSNWFARKQLPGAGLLFKFANFENRLIRFILEKQGFKESTQDYGMPAAEFYNIANANNCNFL